MFHYSRWRILSILGVVLIGLVLALPNLLDPLGYRAVTDRVGLKPMTLGLDLQGGSNILMEVDRKDLTDKVQQQLMGDIRAGLREQKIGYAGLAKTPDGVTVSLNKVEDADRANVILKKLQQPLDAGILSAGAPVNLFDLKQEGQQFKYTIQPTGFDAKMVTALKQAIRVLELRINGTCEGFGESCFARARKIFQQHMSAARQGGEELSRGLGLPLQDPGDVGGNLLKDLPPGMVVV